MNINNEILENYGLMTDKKLARRLGVSRHKIRREAQNLGIWQAPEESINYVDIEDLEIRYQTATKKECAEHYGVRLAEIVKLMRINDIFKTKRQPIKKGMFNKPKGWNPILNTVIKKEDYDRTY